MVEIVSWVGVAVIALFAVVGFIGVVATTALTVVRSLRHTPTQADAADERHYVSAA